MRWWFLEIIRNDNIIGGQGANFRMPYCGAVKESGAHVLRGKRVPWWYIHSQSVDALLNAREGGRGRAPRGRMPGSPPPSVRWIDHFQRRGM